MVFCLYLDDFRVKYWLKEDKDYLYNIIRKNFRYIVDEEGKNYYRLTLHWNYNLSFVDVAIPKFLLVILKHLNHIIKILP